jgi:hypothetical protein
LKDKSVCFGLIVCEQKTKHLRCSKKKIDLNDIDIDSLHLQQVKSCKYLGAILNWYNSIEEEIKERIALGSKASCVNQTIFKSQLLLLKKAKLKLY